MNIVNGQNSDLVINGIRFHVQTEDWGNKEKYLVSRVFKSGAVIKTYRLSYSNIENCDNLEHRQKKLVEFHQKVIDLSKKEII